MKILQLEILNLASLDKQGGEVINFEKGALGESTIFSIVGPTGSGKSTILDAICLALYNRAPRYPRRRGERNQNIEIFGEPDEKEKNRLAPTDGRNILSRGKKDGFSKLTFQATNGNVYRAEWHVHFKRLDYDKPVTLLFKISTSADGSLLEELDEWDELPNIIGLDYEQFLRTVLIAQGSFANFLTAKENERYELLEKLIGCEEMYTRIAKEIKSKRDEALEAFNRVNASVDAVRQNLLSDEECRLLEEQISQLEKEEEEIAKIKKVVETLLQWFVDDEKIIADIEQQQTKADKARRELEEFQPSISRLNLHDAITPAVDCLKDIKRMEASIEETKKKINEYELKTQQQECLILTANNLLNQLIKAADKVQKTIEETTPHIKNARELKTKIETAINICKDKLIARATAEKEKNNAGDAVKANIADIKKNQDLVKKAEEELQAKRAEVEKKKDELEKATTQAEETLKSEMLKIEGMNADELQSQKNQADGNYLNLKQALEVVVHLHKDRKEETEKKASRKKLKDRNAGLSEGLAKLDIEVLEKEVETLRKTYTLMISEQWSQHRASLEEGKPCPLCGATEHPYQMDETRFEDAASDLHNLLQDKETALKTQKKQKEEWTGEKKKNEGEIVGLEQRLQQLQRDIATYEDEWQYLLEWNPLMNQDQQELEAVLPSFKKKKDEADDKLTFFNKVQKVIGRLTKEKDEAVKKQREYEEEAFTLMTKAQEKLNSANTKLAEVMAITPTLRQQYEEKSKALDEATKVWDKEEQALKDLKTAYGSELGGKDPDDVEQQLKKDKEDADAAVVQKKDDISKMNSALGEKKGILQTKRGQLEKEEQDCARKNEELTEWISQYNDKEDRIKDISLEDIEDMYHATEDWNAIRQEKDCRHENVVSSSALLKKAKDTRDKHQAVKPEKEREVLLAELQELQQKSHNEELVTAKAKMRNHDDAIRLLGDRVEELNQAKKMKEDWTAITDAIGGDGKTLRKIAQCYTLSFLIEHANVEIRKFNSRYELQQVKNSLGIRVIDHDRADDVRDTTSLSGGETFIVSLGLALGLSSLSSRNLSFENLFIDEGFGTLDPETLGTVIDSLAMMQSSQGKKVGVISHTDMMRERITTQIRIIKNGNSGSSHIEIYP